MGVTSLDALVEAMSRPSFYSHRPASVEVVQTHISLIFLAGQYVYKVKKPVDFGFLDFTTLEKRLFFCHEEVRLNQRLAPQVYLGVVAITRSPSGSLVLEGTGEIVEYVVKMLRMPEERMLKKLLARNQVDPHIMDEVAEKLAVFHAEADTGGEVDAIGGFASVVENWDENFRQTTPYIGRTITPEDHSFLHDYVDAFLRRHRTLLERRVAEHRIRDCHGDVHLEHICLLEEGIAIFDCIEFNKRFRYSDVASEVAFLAMDLDFNGYADFSRRFVDSYARVSGDATLSLLLGFYACYRATVRGKVVGFRLEDPAIDEGAKADAASTAARYFRLATAYATQFEQPTLVVMCGLMGTGKSMLASAVAGPLCAELIRMDQLRKELLSIDPAEHRFDAFGEGVYSSEVTSRTYARALEMAAEHLGAGRSVIIDASYRRQADRLAAAAKARELGAEYFVVECTCPEEIVHARLDARLSQPGEPSDGRWELFHRQKASFEPVGEMEGKNHVLVDCGQDLTAAVGEAIHGLRAGGRRGE